MASRRNIFKGVACFAETWWRPGQPAQAGIGVRDNRSQRLFDFVRDGGRHCGKRGVPSSLCKLPLSFTQFIFSILEFRDVPPQAVKSPTIRGGFPREPMI